MLLIVVAVIVGTAYFSYPTMVNATARVSAQNPPSELVARVSGKLQRIFVANGQQVNRGDTLGVVDNSASYRHMAKISAAVASICELGSWQQADSTLLSVFSPQGFVLGDVQGSYAAFAGALASYRLFCGQHLHAQKLSALGAEVHRYNQHIELLNRQLRLVCADYNIALKQFSRDSTLFAAGVIAPVELEQSRSAIIQKQQGVESAKLSVSGAHITVEQLRQSMAETRLEYGDQLQNLTNAVSNSLNQLRTDLAQWERNYLLVAPSSGRLTYMGVWSSLQEVTAASPVFAITPSNMGQVQVHMVVPADGVGRVRPGQRVNVKLDAYPYMEFGTVEATVLSVSAGSTDEGFPAVASLPCGAVTTYGTKLQLERELSGTAEIATDELTVLQRLFGQIRYLLVEKVI